MTLIALIDGALAPDHPRRAEAHDFTAGASPDSPAGRHATAMAAAIAAGCPEARLISLAVLPGALTTSAAALARAFEAAGQTEAPIVHCSLGLARCDPAIAAAVARLITKGRIVVASAPVRGGAVFPAALPGVLSVQGDARCAPGQWSHLGLPTADYGACSHLSADSGIAGASVAAAHLTGILASFAPLDATAARAGLHAGAAHRGRERRTGPRPGAATALAPYDPTP